jgi:Transposase IS66 family
MRSTPIITDLVLVAAGVGVLAGAILMLWLSGDWRWVEGRIFGVWWVSFIAAILLWLRFRDPALLAERFPMPGSGGESRSDLAILIGIKVCFLALIVVPALDVRFGWMPRLPLWSEVCGGILLLGGSFPFFRASTDNTYASNATNNAAERALRPLVVARKNWGGNRTPQGARAQAVLTSIFQTAKQQGKEPFEVLVELLCSNDPHGSERHSIKLGTSAVQGRLRC